MRKNLGIILFIFAFCLTNFCLADEWNDYANNMGNAWDGQKTVTNKEFEQVMDALQAKTKKKEAKQKKKRAKKISGGGTSLHNELNPDKVIQELQSIKPVEEDVLVNIPVATIIDGQPLEKGYYNVVGERDKENNKIYLKLYQAHYLKAKIEATETDNDFDEEEVNFAEVQEYNDSFVRLIFGSIDFNAYAYLPIVEI